MSEPQGFLVVPIGYRADGTIRALELTDTDELKVAISSGLIDQSNLYGWDGSQWVKVLVDSLGNLGLRQQNANELQVGSSVYDGSNWQKLSGDSSGRITLYQVSPANLQVGLNGYDGSNWQKIKTDANGVQIIDGQSPSIFRPIPKNTAYENLTLAAGANDYSIVTVPSGEYWRITSISAQYVGTTTGVSAYFYFVLSGVTYRMILFSPFVSTVIQNVPTNMLISPTAEIFVRVNGATLNDDFRAVLYAERVY